MAFLKATTRGPRHNYLPRLVALIISLPGDFGSWNLIYSLFQKKRTFNSEFFGGPPGE